MSTQAIVYSEKLRKTIFVGFGTPREIMPELRRLLDADLEDELFLYSDYILLAEEPDNKLGMTRTGFGNLYALQLERIEAEVTSIDTRPTFTLRGEPQEFPYSYAIKADGTVLLHSPA